MPVATSFRASRTCTNRRQRPRGLPSILGIIVYGRAESLQIFVAQFLLNMEFLGFILVIHGVLLLGLGLLLSPGSLHVAANINALTRKGGARGPQRKRLSPKVEKLL